MKYVLLAFMFALGCATGVTVVPRLQDRTLLVSPDKPGLVYPHKYQECVSRKWPWRFLGKKCYPKHRVEFYDFRDKDAREQLIDAGFVCQSMGRHQY